MTSTGRVARLTALALATGTLVAAGSGTAGAATKTTNFEASGDGSVLTLTVNLPLSVPGVGDTITTNLVSTGSITRTVDNQAKAVTALGQGTVPTFLGSVLDKSLTAELGKVAKVHEDGCDTLEESVNQLIEGLLTCDLLALDGEVKNTALDGAVSQARSTVLQLKVADVANLQEVLNVLAAQLTAVFDGLLGTLTGTQASSLPVALPANLTTVTDVVSSLISQINTVTQGAAQPVTEAAQELVDQLEALPDTLSSLLESTLKTQLTAAAADPSLLSVGEITSTQEVTRKAGVVTSTSSQTINEISALGGLVTVDALTSTATAALGSGVSKADANPGDKDDALVHVAIKDVLDLKLGDGLGIDLSSGVLPKELTDQVQGALNEVTKLLADVLKPVLTSGTRTETATENKAEATASAATFSIDPQILGTRLFPKPLVVLELVPSHAKVVKAQSVTPPTAVITPGQAGSAPQFAPTGANFGLTAPIAVGLMGLAFVARRRRLAHLEG